MDNKNEKEINVLFLGGAKRVSFANHLKQEGGKLNYDVNIYSYELDAHVPIASVGKVIVGLKWNDKDIIADLQRIINDRNINIVLPFVDHAIAIASQLKSLCRDVFIPVSEISICEIMFDKLKSAEWFKENGIPQPIFYKHINDIQFPVILKPRKGSASKGIIICYSPEELPSQICNYLVQDYISEHDEISVDCYISQSGKILSVVPRIRIETLGGEAVKSETIRDRKIIDLSHKILNSGKFYGPITIQFLKDKMGNYFVMEINPRFGGGVVTSIGAGSGILLMLLNEFLKHEVKPILDWKENTIMVRYFNEVIFYANNC